MEEAIRLIKPGTKHINRQLYVGVALVVVGVILLAIGGVAPPIGIGVLFIVLSLATKNNDVIKVYESYFDVKLAPLAARRFIKKSDIKAVNTSNPKILVVEYDHEGKTKKLKIGKSFLNEEDYQFLTEAVQTTKAA